MLAIAAVLSFARSAGAQPAPEFASDRNFDARLLRPGGDRFAFAATEGSGALVWGEHDVLLAADYAAGVARLGANPNRLDLAGGTEHPLIERAVYGVLGAQFGLLPRGCAGLSLGAAVPLAVLDGPARIIDGSYNAARAPLQSQGIGAPALLVKWSPLPARRAGFGLALLGQLDVGTSGVLRSDPGLALWPRLALDVLAPEGALAFNLGYRVVTGTGPLLTARSSAPRTRYGDQLTVALSARAQLWGPLQGGLGFNAAQLMDAWGARAALASELLAALRVDFGSAVAQLGGGVGLSSGFSAADGRVFASVALGGAPRDEDGDGVSGDADNCPAVAEDFDLVQDHDGCPDDDDDDDGVPDARDGCPRDPARGEASGCPRSALGDRDGDGVDDFQDACPSVRGAAGGCPGVGPQLKRGAPAPASAPAPESAPAPAPEHAPAPAHEHEHEHEHESARTPALTPDAGANP